MILRHTQWTCRADGTEWWDVTDGGMKRSIDVIHIQLCGLDLDTRVSPTRLDSSTPREAESGAPIIQPITRTPEALSRFSANEKPALFSSAPSTYLTGTISHLAPLPFNASQLSNASGAIRPWLVVPNVGRRDPLGVPTGLLWGPGWNCSVAARILRGTFYSKKESYSPELVLFTKLLSGHLSRGFIRTFWKLTFY